MVAGASTVPRECVINFELNEIDRRCMSVQVFQLLFNGTIKCQNMCFIGYIKENGRAVCFIFKTIRKVIFQVQAFFKMKNRKTLSIERIDGEYHYSNDVDFHGIDKYVITESNIYNGIIQTVIKSKNKMFLGLVNITEHELPPKTIEIGIWRLSDILLRDDDVVTVVTVHNNSIFYSNVLFSNPELDWKKVEYSPKGEIEGLEINGKHIQGSDSGDFFEYLLFRKEDYCKPENLKSPIVTPPHVAPWYPEHYIILIALFLVFGVIGILLLYLHCKRTIQHRIPVLNPEREPGIPVVNPEREPGIPLQEMSSTNEDHAVPLIPEGNIRTEIQVVPANDTSRNNSSSINGIRGSGDNNTLINLANKFAD